VAAGLDALGIEAGDVVTIQLPNWAEFAYVFFALERLGAWRTRSGRTSKPGSGLHPALLGERAFVCPASFKASTT